MNFIAENYAEDVRCEHSTEFTNWKLSAYLALLLTLFIICLVLIVKIKYGEMVITRLCTLPYKISLLIFASKIIEIAYSLFYFEYLATD